MGKQPRDSNAEFARLLRKAHREVFGFIFAMLQNRADAEDVYQRTALVLWRKFSRFAPGHEFHRVGDTGRPVQIKDYVKARRRRKVFFNDAILDAIAVAYQAESNDLRTSDGSRHLRSAWISLTIGIDGMLDRCYSVGADYRRSLGRKGRHWARCIRPSAEFARRCTNCVQRTMAAVESKCDGRHPLRKSLSCWICTGRLWDDRLTTPLATRGSKSFCRNRRPRCDRVVDLLYAASP